MTADAKVRVQPSDIPPIANAFSGALGGAVATLSVFPLDLITTRLQLQTKSNLSKPIDKDVDQHYKGLADAIVKIYKQKGISGFYAGAASDTIATTAQAFFYFFAYEKIRSRRVNQIAKHRNGKVPSTLGVGEELLIGSLAGIFAKFFICPLNNIVARQQIAGLEHRHPSATEVVSEIYNDRGITGFWAGYKATVLLSINPSLTYYFFQTLRTILIPKRRRDNPTSTELFFLAAFAKTIATLITYPIILAKTRIQVKNRAESAFRILTRIVHTEGFAGLYLGARTQILKGFFSQGITMMTKDQIARLIIYLYFFSKKYIF